MGTEEAQPINPAPALSQEYEFTVCSCGTNSVIRAANNSYLGYLRVKLAGHCQPSYTTTLIHYILYAYTPHEASHWCCSLGVPDFIFVCSAFASCTRELP